MKRSMALLLFIFVQLCSRSQGNSDIPLLLRKLAQSKEDTTRMSFLLKLGSYYLFNQGGYRTNYDSAINFFNLAAQLSNKLDETDWQYHPPGLNGSYDASEGEWERYKEFFMLMISYYQQTGNLSREADAWNCLGEFYVNAGKTDQENKRLYYYQRAQSLYSQNHQLFDAANTLKNIAEIQLENKQYDLSENELLQVLAQYKVLGYKKLQYTYDRLGDLENGKGNYYRQMAYTSEGIRSMEASGDTTLAAKLYQVMARCNFAVKKYDEALIWIRKAVIADTADFAYKCVLIQTLINLNRITEAGVSLNDLSKNMSHLNITERANLYRVTALYYDKINKNDQAVLYNSKILELGLEKSVSQEYYNIWSVICNNEIAGIYLKTNQWAKAGKYIKNAALIFNNAKTPLDPRYLVAFYDHSYKYEVANGNYRAAVNNLEKHDKLQDSLFTADKDKQIAELNIQYQTAQQEQSIKDLNRESITQQAELGKANLERNITIGGILVMILISALFYRNYKQKQAANNLITHKNGLLQHLLTEKEWLLKEIHHRVKNNLQTVMGLLGTQAGYLKNDEARTAIADSQHRIQSMSLIHQRLYQSNNLSAIKMTDYIHELADFLSDSFNTGNHILFNLDIDPIELDLAHCIPLGLILNEAITNSFKYAFRDDQQGVISITLRTTSENNFLLSINDNGKGLPPGFNVNRSESMGMNLMRGLSQELSAQFIISGENGTRIDIRFAYYPDIANEITQTITETVYPT